jgi:hypothetical protein
VGAPEITHPRQRHPRCCLDGCQLLGITCLNLSRSGEQHVDTSLRRASRGNRLHTAPVARLHDTGYRLGSTPSHAPGRRLQVEIKNQDNPTQQPRSGDNRAFASCHDRGANKHLVRTCEAARLGEVFPDRCIASGHGSIFPGRVAAFDEASESEDRRGCVGFVLSRKMTENGSTKRYVG